MSTTIKIVGTLIAGVISGVVLRVVIPLRWGIFFMGKETGHVIPLNRLAFWACLLVAIGFGAIQLIKAFGRDLGISV